MKRSEPNFPLQITSQKGMLPAQTQQWIRSEAAKLGTFYHRIMNCRVAVGSPHRHHQQGSPYHLRIDLTVPGGDLVINHEPALGTRARQLGETEIRKQFEIREPHRHLRQAINDAFKAAIRRLQDYARRQRGDVKHRELEPAANVARLFQTKGYGFLQTAEGREIYFHKNSVLDRAFGRLKVGTRVRFAEEPGEEGPQASSVQIVGKQGFWHEPEA